MLLLILWALYALTVNASAQKAKARPWPWLAIGAGIPFAFFILSSVAVSSLNSEMARTTNMQAQRIAVAKVMGFWVIVGTIILVIVTRVYLMVRKPFRISNGSA